MTNEIGHSSEVAPEVVYFPTSSEKELLSLKEIVGNRDVSIMGIGEAGYMIFRNNLPIIAEAPWVFLDFDDTIADTSGDKQERCWSKLKEIGLPLEIIRYCDKASRVDFGKAGLIYEPELEMRLVSSALEQINSGKSIEDIAFQLSQIRKAIVTDGHIDGFSISPMIHDLYTSTRYTSTIFPDVPETIRKLRNTSNRPLNVAFLTYGDPVFQLHKTLPLLDGNEPLGTVFLTKVKKGDFFNTLMNTNPFANLNLSYTYDETPRNVGIDFKQWQVMVTLFDDDPSQVESFNTFANENDFLGLGVVRVRRPGAKRSGEQIYIPRGSAEIVTSNTALDTDIFEKAVMVLEAVNLEKFLLDSIQQFTIPEVFGNPETNGVIQAIADRKGQTYDQVENQLLHKALNLLEGAC